MSKLAENYSQWIRETGGSEAAESYVDEVEKQNKEVVDLLLVVYEYRSNMHEEIEEIIKEKLENYYNKQIDQILNEHEL